LLPVETLLGIFHCDGAVVPAIEGERSMGLDLEPLGRAKPGHENEWLELTDLIYEGDELSQPQIERRNAITIQPFEDIGAPRVGSDEEANRWAIELARSNGHPGSDAEIVEELKGHSAVTLMVGRCDGVAEYSAGHTMNHVDGTSFRGQLLEACGDILDEETITQAWQQVFRPEEAVAYGEKLLALLKNGKPITAAAAPKKKGFFDKVFPARPPAPKAPMDDQRAIVEAAGKWFIYWGKKGHPIWANF
jgi:hypothetical protein